ncbi:MAG: glutamyl-Q tRNA(Asp) synthetase [Gammaproteobacteria bacterium]|nr:glutamyl-Q tRNA(Asp) synthetase [Gammaproteobacteria bacterium]
MSAAKSNTATATTDTADAAARSAVGTAGRIDGDGLNPGPDSPHGCGEGRGYVGRFAPSPSGDLHLGSLYTAAASYLDARASGGRWLVRIEDLDGPRAQPGSAAGILRTLRQFGFEWDGGVVHQSERTERYVAAIDTLRGRGLTFECSCSRSQLADEERYPGHCREGPLRPGVPTAIRLRVDPGRIQFADRIQGSFRQDVAAAVGDVVLRRRDQFFSYLLGVVVDDSAQHVTHVVRGADLLDNTPRQIHLQRLLHVDTPSYAHVPVLTEAGGEKLAKSLRSVRLESSSALPQLVAVFGLLGLSPPSDLAAMPLGEAWAWAIGQWKIENVPKRLARPVGHQ